MHRRSYPALIALMLAAALASPAPAAGSEPNADPEIQQDARVAQAFWHAANPACTAGIQFATGDSPTGPNTWAYTALNGCVIFLDVDFYPRPAGLEPEYWSAVMCEIVTHEWGHTLGLEHSADPNSIMYGNGIAPGLVPGCPALPPYAQPAASSKPRAKRARWRLHFTRPVIRRDRHRVSIR